MKQGLLGELRAREAFVRRGIPVYVPLNPADAADLVVLLPRGFQKVQVKTSGNYDAKSTTIRFQLMHKPSRTEAYRRYDDTEVDLFFLIDVVNGFEFLIPYDEVGGHYNIKLNYNNSAKSYRNAVRYSDDWVFGKVIEKYLV